MVIAFSCTLFTSALLLFWVQPMFAKMILPLLGGAPGVWNTSMVFFQALLLAGYVYAHVLTRRLDLKKQVLVHVPLLLLALAVLPIRVPEQWTPPASANPTPWLLLLLLAAVGLPAFMISTTAPLLQKWFALTDHPESADPYFLYSASNAGSMIALLGYPLLLEPQLRLSEQSWAWSVTFGVLVALVAGCAVYAMRNPPVSVSESPAGNGSAVHPAGDEGAVLPWKLRGRWFLLAFAPSSLLLGVTTHITTDIAAVPLLWVIPLALYLLTFVIVFARRPLLKHRWMTALQPFVVLPMAFVFAMEMEGLLGTFPLHLLAFFVLAMVCHGELAGSRPATSHLTEFYLWMSFGGVMGGLFNALAAPMIFSTVAEYPLVFLLACALGPMPPASGESPAARKLDVALPAAVAVSAVALIALFSAQLSMLRFLMAKKGVFLLAGALVYFFRARPVRFGLGVGAILLAGLLVTGQSEKVMYRVRNFFGVTWVAESANKRFHILNHGRAVHGAQSLDPSNRREPLTYYSWEGPLGQVFRSSRGSFVRDTVAVIGLGAGSIASYGKAGQEITFYEIDPDVEKVARDQRYFTFLAEAESKVDVVVGDARLKLSAARDGAYDLIIIDAFSSDAIPIHLITREALSLYLAKLEDGGLLVFNISNRYLDLKPVLADLAADLGLYAVVRNDTTFSMIEAIRSMKSKSTWVVMARGAEQLGYLPMYEGWRPLAGKSDGSLWTDDFSNILSVFTWR